MKVVKAEEMARIEQVAYQRGASEEEFMNCAGRGVAELAQRCIAHYHLTPKITLLCGKGNNAGDAYVAGCILQEGGFQVNAIALAPLQQSSPLCQLQSKRFLREGGVIEYPDKLQSISFSNTELLIDGILGTGFRGEVKGMFRAAIERANISNIPIVSIDVPSGVNGNTGEVGSVAIKATETLFLGLPKTGCFFGEVWNYIGKVHVFDFGLGDAVVTEAQEDLVMIDDPMIGRLMPPIVRTRHKYQAGYVVGLGGSSGMPGAPLMASSAALRSGAGIVRLLHPQGMEAELALAPYELIRQGYQEGDIETVLEAVKRASAVFIGPGMGTTQNALQMLKKGLLSLPCPCVVDADALTLIGKHQLSFPPQTIITPHHGEMKRLLDIRETLSFTELIAHCQIYAEKKQAILVLKGAPTFIFHSHLKPHVCARGDPGMATAGSGDVLTGIIAAFLAQTHDPFKAALLGVQFHAMAGEKASEKLTPYCMTANDITEALPQIFENYQSQTLFRGTD